MYGFYLVAYKLFVSNNKFVETGFIDNLRKILKFE